MVRLVRCKVSKKMDLYATEFKVSFLVKYLVYKINYFIFTKSLQYLEIK